MRTVVVSLLALWTLALAGCSGSSPSSSSVPVPPVNPVGVNLTQVSTDPYTVAPGQHATEVEPHMIANGNTLVAAFQTGRISPGGATAIGWATSTDGGTTWNHGFLAGLTTGEGSGPYDAASDPAVAYDAKHGVWMISSLPISNTSQTPAVVVSRSTDGVNLAESRQRRSDLLRAPIRIGLSATVGSAVRITAIAIWSGTIRSTRTDFDEHFADGGLTWGRQRRPRTWRRESAASRWCSRMGRWWYRLRRSKSMSAFSSSDGGQSWTAPVIISNVQFHADAGGIRSGPLPSAAVDGAGTVWMVWEDCRFRSTCSTNDLVYSTSADGVTWSVVTRVPIDDISSTVDHFIPGVGIDPATSGASAHVALHYYYYSQSNCTVLTCQLIVGYVSSANGGSTWNAPVALTGPMQLGWLPNSQNGLMVGDYIATVFTNGIPHGVFAVARANSGTTFSEAIYTGQGLTVTAAGRQLSAAGDRPLHRLSDTIERERPEKGMIPPLRRSRRKAK